MKYLLVALLLAAITGVEVFHVLAAERATESAMCTSADEGSGRFLDALLVHRHGH